MCKSVEQSAINTERKTAAIPREPTVHQYYKQLFREETEALAQADEFPCTEAFFLFFEDARAHT